MQFPIVYAPFPKLCNAGAGGYETTVTGNIVGGTPIAGQISVAARFGLEGSQGYIESISNGVMQIKGGPRVRINDPEGAYAPKVQTKEFFIMDTENPSVSSFSGFPMCIPHAGNSATCNDDNRPAGQSNFDAPDPLAMVPLKAGDFIEYAGLPNGNGEILAHSVTCINVQVTTKASDTVPNYIRVEDMLVGVVDNAANVEFADIKAIGFLSSCAGATVTLSAIDVDPCTGVETLRRIDSITPKQETRCKWEIRTATKTPYTRDYMITTNFPVKETKNGIKAGQFVAAVSEWIFPEVDVPGTFPPPLIFTDIQGLVQGDVLDDQQFGQLFPFPGANAPSPKKQCQPSDLVKETPSTGTTPPDSNAPTTNDPSTGSPSTGNPSTAQTLPVAAAVQFSATQRSGTTLSLTGSNTEQKLTNDQLNFAWSQTSPTTPSVKITNPSSASASFDAPLVSQETTFNFTLTVSLKSDPNAKSEITVPIKVSGSIPDTVTMDTYTWQSKSSGTIAVTCSSNVRDGTNKAMRVIINGVLPGFPMGLSGGNGRWAFNSAKVNRPTRLQCVSDLTGKSAERAGTATTSRRKKRGVLSIA